MLLFIAISANSQSRYWVLFSDKDGTTFNPYEYFDQKAIDRRIKHGISLYDLSDYPVRTDYISQVNILVDSVNVVTRWFNGVSVIATPEQINDVKQLPFVTEISPIFMQADLAYDTVLSYVDSTLLEDQIDVMQGKKFIENNINGKGIRIAVFDAGFPTVDVNPAFEHIRNDNRIIKTYDFAKKDEFVYKYNSHGTMVLSCVAGKIGDRNIGLATEAEFLLARTEVEKEPFSEEENWLAAAEWADKNGADIITSSLGYTVPRYFQYNMDGKTTFVAKAAKTAFDKGMLVVNAMGNDGDGKWKVVGTPADVEEVLSVGGVNPDDGTHIYFSSFGPTADGRLKPEVCAAGKGLVAGKTGLKVAYGTSFATPFVTGFAACVLQQNNTLTNIELKKEIIKSANLYPYFDYAHGYGTPQAGYFTDKDTTILPTFKYSIADTSVYVYFEGKSPEDVETDESDYFFYHFRHADGKISIYKLLSVYEDHIKIDIPQKDEPLILMMHYKGYTTEIKIEN